MSSTDAGPSSGTASEETLAKATLTAATRSRPAVFPRYAAFVIAAATTLWLLQELRSVLQPVVIAVLIWFLVGAVARQLARFSRGPTARPMAIHYLSSGIFFLASLSVVIMLLSDSVADLRTNLPVYRENLNAMIRPLAQMVGMKALPPIESLTDGVDLPGLLLGLLGSAAGSLGSLVLIACFVFFTFAEAQFFETKLAQLTGGGARDREMTALFTEIGRKVETYLGLKCLIGLVQAAPTYLVLSLVGVDSPIVWAVLIFLMSFIPTIGSMIGIALPALLALIQFDTPVNFLITLACLAPVQVLASNWLEPRLTGDSLNLSPLAIFTSILAGGVVWGVVGALISVPALTIVAIACAQSPKTRAVAVILSRDGRPMM
ncbi:MAG: AI-2E family transporter [Pseudomonadota bacterium]